MHINRIKIKNYIISENFEENEKTNHSLEKVYVYLALGLAYPLLSVVSCNIMLQMTTVLR